jgi:oligoribonuclease
MNGRTPQEPDNAARAGAKSRPPAGAKTARVAGEALAAIAAPFGIPVAMAAPGAGEAGGAWQAGAGAGAAGGGGAGAGGNGGAAADASSNVGPAPIAAAPGATDDTRLVWVDMEMTGLRPEIDRIIEVAIVITDSDLNPLAEGPVLVIHQPDAVLDAMDAWNTATHGRSGLTEQVRRSRITEAVAQAQLLDFLRDWVPQGKSPMCGNSICQDRRFMARYMPELEAWFHYRNLDVSTVKELCKRWAPAVARGFDKRSAHTALADILESIEELRYYRDHFIAKPSLA